MVHIHWWWEIPAAIKRNKLHSSECWNQTQITVHSTSHHSTLGWSGRKLLLHVLAGSSSRGGNVAVFDFDINQTELAHSFSFCSCIYFCLCGSFNCISFQKFSRQLSAFSLYSSVLFLPYWSFQLYLSLWKSPSALIWSLMVDWAQNTN